jgi:hypothetical protein
MYQTMRILALTLLLAPCCASGQQWFPDEAVWHHGYVSGSGQQGHVRMEVAGDTAVGGQTCRKLERTRHTYDFLSQQYGTQPLAPIMAYEAGGIVWVYVPAIADFDTLYDFNAVPGDHWRLPAIPQPVFMPESHMVVTGTGTMLISSTTLRWMAVDVHFVSDGGSLVVQDTVIERIGTGIYFLPHDHGNGEVDGQEAGLLRCYQDAEVGYSVTSQPCDIILGLEEATGTGPASAYPNPNTGMFTLSLPQYPQARELMVYDATGRVVLSQVIANVTGTVAADISGHENGPYLVQVRFADGTRAVARVVKE